MINKESKIQTVDNKTIIELEHVSKSYSTGAPALNDVSIKINRGEFVFIVGDSGSGKSTLIKLLLKELNPSDGNVFVDGENVGKLRRRKVPKFRRRIGVVFQDFRLLKDRDVFENVAFAQRIIQVPTREIKKNVPNVLSKVGLAAKYKAKPRQLSGGEQQRVAIARALINKPKILLADEPTGNLDSNSSKEIMNILKGLHAEGSTVILITHDNSIAEQADRIINIIDGRIEKDHIKGE